MYITCKKPLVHGRVHRLKIATTSTGSFDLYFRNSPSKFPKHIMKDDFSFQIFFPTGCSENNGWVLLQHSQRTTHQNQPCFVQNDTNRLFLVQLVSFTQFTSIRVIKKTSGGAGRENNHWVINQNQWCFIPNCTTRQFFVPRVDFTQLKSNPKQKN